jgi:hypothetical protein
MAVKVKALGTLFQAQIVGVYTTIAQRVSIDPNETSIEMKEVTDLDSAAVERRPTLPDGGQLGMQVWLDPNDTTHQFLQNAAITPPAAPVGFKLIFPSSPTRTGSFSGYVSSYKPGGVDPKGYLTADVKIDVTGAVTWS